MTRALLCCGDSSCRLLNDKIEGGRDSLPLKMAGKWHLASRYEFKSIQNQAKHHRR